MSQREIKKRTGISRSSFKRMVEKTWLGVKTISEIEDSIKGMPPPKNVGAIGWRALNCYLRPRNVARWNIGFGISSKIMSMRVDLIIRLLHEISLKEENQKGLARGCPYMKEALLRL